MDCLVICLIFDRQLRYFEIPLYLNFLYLTAAGMENIVKNFSETFGIDENQSRKRDEHHQPIGSKNARIETNCTKLSLAFSEYDVTLEGQDSV